MIHEMEPVKSRAVANTYKSICLAATDDIPTHRTGRSGVVVVNIGTVKSHRCIGHEKIEIKGSETRKRLGHAFEIVVNGRTAFTGRPARARCCYGFGALGCCRRGGHA